MRTLLLLALIPVFATAQCVYTNNSGCPVPAVSGDVSGSSPTITVNAGSTYNSSLSLAVDIFYPKGVTNSCIIIGVHGGAWYEQNRANLFDNLAGGPVLVSEQTGCAFYSPDYRLAASGGVGVWPDQWQDIRCLIYEIVANHGTSSWPGNPYDIRIYGESAGAQIGWQVALGNVGSWTDSCPASASSAFAITRVILVSPPPNVAREDILSGSIYVHADPSVLTEVQTGVDYVLNCSSQSTCQAADAALDFSPVTWIPGSMPWVLTVLQGGADLYVPPLYGGAEISTQYGSKFWQYFYFPTAGHGGDLQNGASGVWFPVAVSAMSGNGFGSACSGCGAFH